MSEQITVNGLVLAAAPAGDFDKRLVLLTRERGKITAFARGARRTNSPLLAAANPFVFGTFFLYEGRSSYYLTQADASYRFRELTSVLPGVYYGFYFLEAADYYGREYTDEREMLNLLYVTLCALLSPEADNELIRAVFELRTLAVQGECPSLSVCACCGKETELSHFGYFEHGALCAECGQKLRGERLSPVALYTLRYIAASPLSKLYGFRLEAEARREVLGIVGRYFRENTDRKFKSLEILRQMS